MSFITSKISLKINLRFHTKSTKLNRGFKTLKIMQPSLLFSDKKNPKKSMGTQNPSKNVQKSAWLCCDCESSESKKINKKEKGKKGKCIA